MYTHNTILKPVHENETDTTFLLWDFVASHSVSCWDRLCRVIELNNVKTIDDLRTDMFYYDGGHKIKGIPQSRIEYIAVRNEGFVPDEKQKEREIQENIRETAKRDASKFFDDIKVVYDETKHTSVYARAFARELTKLVAESKSK